MSNDEQRPWRGQSMPRSATGHSALVEQLPHHISSDNLHVSFRADPARIARFLPPGLEPLESGDGWATIAEMAKVSASDPDQAWRTPARSTYNEGLVGFYCRYQGLIGRYSALVWVDRDWSMAMGPIFGWPKRLAQVDRTRLQPFNPAFKPAGPGVRVGGTVTRFGSTVLRLAVQIPAEAQPLDRLPGHGASTFLYRYIASPSPDVSDVEQLFELQLAGVRSSEVWAGTGEIEFGASTDEELPELGPVKVTGGYLYQRGWTTAPVARLLRDYQNETPGAKSAAE